MLERTFEPSLPRKADEESSPFPTQSHSFLCPVRLLKRWPACVCVVTDAQQVPFPTV